MNTHGQGGVFPKRGHTECNGSLTGRYMLLQGLNWSAFAVIWVYAVVLLRGSGLSYSQAGLVISLANILAVFAQQGLSAWADRAAVDSSAKAAVGLVSLGAAALLFLLAGFGGKALAGVCFCLIGVAIIGVQPFLNAAAMERVQQGLALNYGLARGIGSVSYAAFSALAGVILGRFGGSGLVATYIFLSLAVLLALAAFSAGAGRTVSARQSGETLSGAALLRRNPQFCWFLASSVLLYAAHMMAITYMDAIVGRAGGTEAELGLAVAVGAAAEFPAMALLQRIRGRFSAKQILLFSAVSFAVKLLCLAAAVSMTWVYLASLLQLAAYSLFTGMSVYYVTDVVDSANQAKGQALCSGASTVGAVLGNYAGGMLLEHLSVGRTMLFGALLAGAGAVLLTRCFNGSTAPSKV